MKPPNLTVIKNETNKPNEFIVKELERYLEEAKSGQMQDFMMIAVYSDELIGNSFYGYWRPYSLLGQALVTQADIMRVARLTRESQQE